MEDNNIKHKPMHVLLAILFTTIIIHGCESQIRPTAKNASEREAEISQLFAAGNYLESAEK